MFSDSVAWAQARLMVDSEADSAEVPEAVDREARVAEVLEQEAAAVAVEAEVAGAAEVDEAVAEVEIRTTVEVLITASSRASAIGAASNPRTPVPFLSRYKTPR